MKISRPWEFFLGYLRAPKLVGAITPSSRALALALCDPLSRSRAPVRVLEVGAGTGAVTRQIAETLSSEDEFDICEIQPEFAAILRRDVLTLPALQPAVDAGRVRLYCCPVQQLAHVERYDFVISGLPFTAFEPDDVQAVFDVLRRALKRDGVLSYYEYVGMRQLSRWFGGGRTRDRVRAVWAYLQPQLRDFQVERRVIFQNLPPAFARHLCFTPRPAPMRGLYEHAPERVEDMVPQGLEGAPSQPLG